MSFREKSAWAMLAVMVLTGLYFLWLTHGIPADAPPLAQRGAFAPYVLVVIILSIVVQVVLALLTPGEAGRSADERERIAIERAGNWSGYVLGFAVISGALNYLIFGDGTQLFLWVVGGLIIAQIADYAFQIFLFRRGV